MDTTKKPRKWLTALRWLGESFGPLLVFYAFEHTLGLLAAIISSIVLSVALVTRQILAERKISRFTAFVAVSVVVFGVLDLRYQTGFFVKLEPALGNAATALFFLGSIAWGQPIVCELAERAAGRKLDHVRGYLTAWTGAWGVFFLARAAGFLWMAYHVTLDQALFVRAVVGPLSFLAMIGAEMVVRRLVFGDRLKKRAAAVSAPQPAE